MDHNRSCGGCGGNWGNNLGSNISGGLGSRCFNLGGGSLGAFHNGVNCCLGDGVTSSSRCGGCGSGSSSSYFALDLIGSLDDSVSVYLCISLLCDVFNLLLSRLDGDLDGLGVGLLGLLGCLLLLNALDSLLNFLGLVLLLSLLLGFLD